MITLVRKCRQISVDDNVLHPISQPTTEGWSAQHYPESFGIETVRNRSRPESPEVEVGVIWSHTESAGVGVIRSCQESE